VTSALLLSGGTAPYSDPWHPFAETSVELEKLAREVGFDVEVSHDPASRLADLDGVDVIIANVPAPSEPVEGLEDAAAGLRTFLARPGGVVALHVSVTTLLGLPDWSAAIGARWVEGTMHPPRGAWPVRSVSSHPLAPSASSFELDDELYSFMAWDAPVDTVVEHELEGTVHPLVWTREVGPTRVFADALGHGVASYDSPEHTDLLRRALRWAARES
jgi:type 1 glutamine amidotransferase